MTHRPERLARLESFLRRSRWIRRLLFYGGTLFPACVAALLAFLALYPMVFAPGDQLLGTLGTLVAGGLSFSGVSFAAAASSPSRSPSRIRSQTPASAGSRNPISGGGISAARPWIPG